MIDTSKRISIRVTEQCFYELDDKRQAMRVSFQALGFALFRSWLECFPGAGFSAAVADSIRAQEPGARIPEEDPATRPPAVQPHLNPVAARLMELWEHPKNAFEESIKRLLAETVLKDVVASTARKTSGL
jgi:hypothetical protein